MSVTFKTISVPENGGIPNNPLLPAVVVAGAVGSDVTGDEVRRLYAQNGWGGAWEYTVFDYHHFHPASHEALTCISGTAELQLGGPDGPVVEVQQGDAVILPAGFGHKRLTSTPTFKVAGAYPPGQEHPAVVAAGAMDLAQARASISATPLPETDPHTGSKGVLLEIWAGHAD